MDPEPERRPASHETLIGRLESLRPKPSIAGGVVARGMALAVDLTVLAIATQVAAGMFALSQRVANQLGLVAFALTYVATHKR